jgi:hypothetical protein
MVSSLAASPISTLPTHNMAELSSLDMVVPLALEQQYWPTLSAGNWQDVRRE